MEYSISSAHGTFFRIDHILGHKTSLNKFQKIKILSSISDHSVVGLLNVMCQPEWEAVSGDNGYMYMYG